MEFTIPFYLKIPELSIPKLKNGNKDVFFFLYKSLGAYTLKLKLSLSLSGFPILLVMLSVAETSSEAQKKYLMQLSPFLMCFPYSVPPLRYA